jgi:hypothetical protein
MKKKLRIFFGLATFAVVMLLAYSCVEPDDLVTENAKTGGLLTTASQNLSFKGVPLTITVGVSEGVESVSFYKNFTFYLPDDTITTDEVLHVTVTPANGVASFTSTYDQLKAGIASLPATAGDLKLADFWRFRIVSTMEDGREVESYIKINLTVDNPYSGTYTSSGTRWNFANTANANTTTMPPTGTIASSANFSLTTSVKTVDGNTCRVHVGNAEQATFGYMNIRVNGDNTVTIIPTEETLLNALAPLAGHTSTYDPATKRFTLYYEWTNADGAYRVMRHYLDLQ